MFGSPSRTYTQKASFFSLEILVRVCPEPSEAWWWCKLNIEQIAYCLERSMAVSHTRATLVNLSPGDKGKKNPF